MTLDEIKRTVADYAAAARNARLAGFDGVELHAATTYLMPEFLNSSLNQRQDQYGGSPENRARIVLEALEAMIAEWGTGKVGIKMARPQRWAASIRLGRPFQPTIIWSRG
jgi:N-ethylmaleimide reductase